MPKKIIKKKKGNISKPRGMRDIMGEDFYSQQGFYEKSAEISSYYGFEPIDTPIMEREEVFLSSVGAETDMVKKEMYYIKGRSTNKIVLRPEGTAGIMRAYIEGGMHTKPQPVMFYYYGPFFRHEKPQKGRLRQFHQFGLEMIGTEKSISDAIVIRVATTIIEDAGAKNLLVKINSIGDKNCRPEYIKALTKYYRKHLNNLCSNCRQRIKKNPLRLLDCKDLKCEKFKEEAPEIIGFICEPCKKHFKEVLEYLDQIEIPYIIDSTLVRGIDYYTRTVFELINEEDKDNEDDDKEQNDKDKKKKDSKVEEKKKPEIVLAAGGRYDDLSKSLGSKQKPAGVGVAIGVERVLAIDTFIPHPPRVMKKPKAYFIQIGVEAKLHSIEIIEILRKAKIPVFQSLNRDRLSVQLGIAESKKIPYTIILGQKEALEGTVIVRKMKSHSQKTVRVEKLAEYLKKNL